MCLSQNAMKDKLKTDDHLTPQSPKKRWGIDISSTKIEGIIIDEAQPEKPLCRVCLPIEPIHAYDHLRGYDHIIAQVQLVTAKLEKTSGLSRPAAIGVATAGVTQPSTGILKKSSTLCLTGHTVKKDLSIALGTEVLLSNDANCFALAEAIVGAARGHKVVIGLILETGIGSGIVIGGHLLHGLHGIAGEWGHNIMCGEKTLCHCGKQGCNETVFSELALLHFYEKITGEEVTIHEIIKRAQLGERKAIQTLLHLQKKFAAAIASLINILDPDAIVIGGKLGAIDLLYEGSTRTQIFDYTYSNELKTSFLKPALGDSAKVFGAALLSGLPQSY